MKTINKQLHAGSTLIEYAILTSGIALVCIVAVGFLGSRITELFTRIGDALTGAFA